jgi:hypothetical protein
MLTKNLDKSVNSKGIPIIQEAEGEIVQRARLQSIKFKTLRGYYIHLGESVSVEKEDGNKLLGMRL